MYFTLYYNKYYSPKPISYPSNKMPEVYLKYNKIKDSITYVVLPHHKKDLEGKPLTFEIYGDLLANELDKIQRDIGFFEYRDLICIIAQIEKEAFETKKESFMHVFDDASKGVKQMLALPDIDTLIKVREVRDNFSTSVSRILNNQDTLLDLNKSTTSKKCDCQLNIKYWDDENIYVSLKVGADKYYSIRYLDDFFDDFDERYNYKFGKYLTLKLCPESFVDRALEVFNIVRKKPFYRNDITPISIDDFAKLLNLYKNETLIVGNDKYVVSNEILEPEVTISEEGKYVFSPSFKSSIELIIGKNYGLALDKIKKSITPLHFQNGAQASIYQLGQNLNYNFDLVEDLITDEFRNFSHKSLRLKVENKENIPLKIKLYISLDLEKNVIFKTIYEFEGNEVSKDEIKKMNKFDSLLLEYEIRLQELSLLENGKSKDLETLNNVLVADYGRLREIADVYLSDEIASMKKSRLQNIQIKASSGSDWLSVQVSSDEYSPEELKAILSAYKKKKKFVLLKNNFVSLDNKEELNELAQLQENFNLTEDMSNVEVPMYQIFKLASLENSKSINVSYDKEIKNIILSIKNFAEKEINLNSSLLSILRPYQIEAVKWMKTLYDNKLSGILADDMGLGKSIEFISFRTLIEEKAPTLIVCPKSLIYNWRNEFKKWDPSSTCYLIDGNKSARLETLRKADGTNGVIIISYDSLRSDLEEYKKIHFALVCLDEAQYIKNSFTKKSKAVKQLDASSRFALTGTPIENALTDLWSIFDFLMPRYLSSEENFSKEYENGFKEADETLKSKLLAKITPFILRRSKNDVLTDLPPKTTEIINIAMSKKQGDLYNAYVLSTRASINENPKNKLAVLSALTRLRQICVDPSSFLENYNEISPKLEYTANLVQTAIESGHKVLVFSQFTTVLEHLRSILKENKISFYYICGDTKANERLVIADNFNKSKTTNVILVSLKAGGTGLNLHGADTVVHLDPWRNFAVEDQATDRAS